MTINQICEFLKINDVYNFNIIEENNEPNVRIVFDVPKNEEEKQKIFMLVKTIRREFVSVCCGVKIAFCEYVRCPTQINGLVTHCNADQK